MFGERALVERKRRFALDLLFLLFYFRSRLGRQFSRRLLLLPLRERLAWQRLKAAGRRRAILLAAPKRHRRGTGGLFPKGFGSSHRCGGRLGFFDSRRNRTGQARNRFVAVLRKRFPRQDDGNITLGRTRFGQRMLVCARRGVLGRWQIAS